MIVQMYAVVDRISGVFDGPHKAINEGQFLRSFSDSVKDPSQGIYNHPEDFYVVHLGSFNDASGEIIPKDGGPLRVADATDFVVKVEEK